MKIAAARIKINKLLDYRGSLFVAPEAGAKNANTVHGNEHMRDAIDHRLEIRCTTAPFNMANLQAVPGKYQKLIPESIKDYVRLNQFLA